MAHVGVHWYRWVVLALYFANTWLSSVMWLSFGPVSKKVREHYDTTTIMVNLLAISYMAECVLLIVVTSLIFKRWGLRVGVVAASVLNTVGAWVRYLGRGPDDFHWVLVGQFVCAATQPFFTQTPSKISANWFGDSERSLATAICTLANLLGVASAFIMVPHLVLEPGDIPRWLLITALMSSVVGGATVLFFKDHPALPPSHSSLHMLNKADEHFRDQLRLLFGEPSFLVLMCGFGLGLGVFNGLSTVMQQVVHPEGYTDKEAGLLGVLLIVPGVVGAAVASTLADRTRQYKRILSSVIFLALAAFAWFVFSIKPHNMPMLAASISMCSVFAVAMMPVCLEYAAEVSFPAPETLSAGFMMVAGQLCGTVNVVVMGTLKSADDRMRHSCYYLLGVFGAASLFLVLMKDKRKRLAFEQRAKTPGEAGTTIDASPFLETSQW